MRKYKITILAALLILVLFYLLCWKIPIMHQIEHIKIPAGCETIYKTKIHISDVYWLHIKGEKVIKCSLGYEETKEYIETHNSASALTNITIMEYAGMSDIAVYESAFDEEFWKQPDRDHYIKISYFKKLNE